MANNFVRMVFAVVKENGYNTDGMSYDEAYKIFEQLGGEKNWANKAYDYKSKNTANQKNDKNNIKDNVTQEIPEENKAELVDFVDRKNKKELELTIKTYCDWLANEKIEHNIIIDKDGNIWHKAGNETRVEKVSNIVWDEAIDIHNHCDYPHSFSSTDLQAVFENKNTTFMLVDKEFIYIVKALKNISEGKNYYAYGLQNSIANEFKNTQQEHYTLEEMKKDGIVEYERIPRRD